MNLLSIKKHTDTLSERTKSHPQETLEFNLIKQLETFSFSLRKNLSEEGKWLLAVTSFETTSYVFNITDENNTFSIGTPGFWRIPNYLIHGFLDRLKELLKLRSQKFIELHVKEVEKKVREKK